MATVVGDGHLTLLGVGDFGQLPATVVGYGNFYRKVNADENPTKASLDAALLEKSVEVWNTCLVQW